MSDNKRKAEILAPAGSVEQLIAAVNNGCDSVYLGLDSFNARMKAPNFNTDNISQWIDYCHSFGVKVYVAINTSLKNTEFAGAVELLKVVYLANADGVIVTDLALMQIAGRFPKPFDVVASTQLNVHDGFGARFAKECGATTVVCARESSLEEIRDVASTGVNVECFVHGATCVCQSGQCLFSAMVGGNSGNRGLCAQPCRKLYSADSGANWGYLLSARDLCGLDVAKQLQASGVSTYKIEGRNRRAEYAGATSKVYRSLFDNNFVYSQQDVDDLAEMYNREMSALNYLQGENSKIITPYAQNHVGVRVGAVCKNGFIAEKEITKGDGLKVFDNKREVCGGVAVGSGLGFVPAEFSGKIQEGMEVRRTTSVKLCEEINKSQRKLPVSVQFFAKPNENPCIIAICNGISAQYTADFVIQKAQNRATSESEIAEQLNKTGNSHYTITDIASNATDVFLSKSQLNTLRREVLALLDIAIVEHYNGQFANRQLADLNGIIKTTVQAANINNTKSYTVAVICYTVEHLQQAKGKCEYLIYKPEIVDEASLDVAKRFDAFIDLPAFSCNKYVFDLLSNTKVGVVCHNLGHVALARELDLPYVAGTGLNIYNDYMASQFADAVTFVYSQELTLNEIKHFKNQNGLIFVDGQITLMKLVHCPYKVTRNCSCANCMAKEPLSYVDEMGNRFNITRRKDKRCTFELTNGKKLSVAAKLTYGGRYLIDFDSAVLNHYKALNDGVNDGYTETAPYTKGRLFNKVN